LQNIRNVEDYYAVMCGLTCGLMFTVSRRCWLFQRRWLMYRWIN